MFLFFGGGRGGERERRSGYFLKKFMGRGGERGWLFFEKFF